jgi:hypothetical protein
MTRLGFSFATATAIGARYGLTPVFVSRVRSRESPKTTKVQVPEGDEVIGEVLVMTAGAAGAGVVDGAVDVQPAMQIPIRSRTIALRKKTGLIITRIGWYRVKRISPWRLPVTPRS